jgi:hypothetical protein
VLFCKKPRRNSIEPESFVGIRTKFIPERFSPLNIRKKC